MYLGYHKTGDWREHEQVSRYHLRKREEMQDLVGRLRLAVCLSWLPANCQPWAVSRFWPVDGVILHKWMNIQDATKLFIEKLLKPNEGWKPQS